MPKLIVIDPEKITEIRKALATISLHTKETPVTSSVQAGYLLSRIAGQVHRIDQLLPKVKFEG